MPLPIPSFVLVAAVADTTDLFRCRSWPVVGIFFWFVRREINQESESG